MIIRTSWAGCTGWPSFHSKKRACSRCGRNPDNDDARLFVYGVSPHAGRGGQPMEWRRETVVTLLAALRRVEYGEVSWTRLRILSTGILEWKDIKRVYPILYNSRFLPRKQCAGGMHPESADTDMPRRSGHLHLGKSIATWPAGRPGACSWLVCYCSHPILGTQGAESRQEGSSRSSRIFLNVHVLSSVT